MYRYSCHALRERYRWFRNTQWYAQQPVRATVKFGWWAIRESLSREFSFRTPDGVRMVSMPGNFSSMAMYLQSDRDPEIQAVIRRVVPKGGVFVDIGANTGIYTVRASQAVGPQGRVVAIEAHPVTFSFLQRTIAANGFDNVVALNVAAGEARKTVRMNYVSINPGQTFVDSDDGAEVAMITVDGCMQELSIKSVDYLKIDVEGYELFVVQGARRTIESNRNIVVQTEQVESLAQRYGHSARDVAELLSSYGLQPHRVDKSGHVRAVPESDWHLPGDYLWAFRPLV